MAEYVRVDPLIVQIPAMAVHSLITNPGGAVIVAEDVPPTAFPPLNRSDPLSSHGFGVGVAVAVSVGVGVGAPLVVQICKVQPLNVPTSSAPLSVTVRVHVPAEFCPLKNDSDSCGRCACPSLQEFGDSKLNAALSSRPRLKLSFSPHLSASRSTSLALAGP